MSDIDFSAIRPLVVSSANRSGSSGIAHADVADDLSGVGDDRNRRQSCVSFLVFP